MTLSFVGAHCEGGANNGQGVTVQQRRVVVYGF